ncbi:hypothetical protein ACLB2K_038694 [Fragaria x ananassa]
MAGPNLLTSLLLLSLISVAFTATDPNDLAILNQFRKNMENPDLLNWPSTGDDPCGPPKWDHVFPQKKKPTCPPLFLSPLPCSSSSFSFSSPSPPPKPKPEPLESSLIPASNPCPSTPTVFAPADAAFASSGQPTPDLIRFHLVPAAIPLRSLKSLPFGAKILTLLDGHSLTVTTLLADDLISLNNVTVAPIFDDGELVIFEIDRFFDLNFRIESHSPKILGCSDPRNPNEAMVAKTAASWLKGPPPKPQPAL